jgi:4-cresol dehydrogenase (hydroxylating) cytochrome subunit
VKRKANCGTQLTMAACAIVLASTWTGTASAQVAGQWKDGQHVYSKICSNCHEIGVGPVIKGRSLEPEYYRHVVRNGLRAMPAFRPTDIDDEALHQVADLLSKSPAPGGVK